MIDRVIAIRQRWSDIMRTVHESPSAYKRMNAIVEACALAKSYTKELEDFGERAAVAIKEIADDKATLVKEFMSQ